jgi:N-methylhydantoinase A
LGLAPGVECSLSCEVLPEIREYERASTTVANVYVKPLAKRYLARLKEDFAALGVPREPYIMLSNGGVTTCEVAAEYPVRLVESGPAAGALAACHLAAGAGLDHVISFDMGGTTAKICLIERGRPFVTTDFEAARVYRFKKGSGLPLRVPVIEMIEIGAGGGSVAAVDRMGLLKVGPASAGADPGPACYGRGGRAPTVTDADLVLGYLDPAYFLGGRMALDVDGARRAIEEGVGRPLGLGVVEAAWGIHQVVNENMANAARIHMVEKGRDPRRYAMVVFGGAGPVHAYRVAKRLKLETILCPPGAGVTSAFGMLAAPMAFDFVQTYLSPLGRLDFSLLNELLEAMEERGRGLLAQAGVAGAGVTVSRSADMRYRQQGFEISVPVPAGRLGPEDTARLAAAFDREYELLYKRLNPGVEVEAVSWRVVVSGPRPDLSLAVASGPEKTVSSALKGEREVYLPESGGFCRCPVYDRYRLFPGAEFSGPAVVEERESTAVLGPDAKAVVDARGNLLVTVAA